MKESKGPKVIEFKTVSPLFEQEMSSEKPFTLRKVDLEDKRFRMLKRWSPSQQVAIKIVNPAGGLFIREVTNVSFMYLHNRKTGKIEPDYDWMVIGLGRRIG